MRLAVIGLAVVLLTFEAQHALLDPGAPRAGALLISAAAGACAAGALWLAGRRRR
jgi:hypothetical protein